MFYIPDVLKQEWQEDFDINKSVRTIKYKWRCPKCSSIWNQSIANRLRGGEIRGCQYCSGKKVNETNSLATKYPELSKRWNKNNKLTPDNVTCHSNKSYIWDCPKCLSTYSADVSHQVESFKSNKLSCPFCHGKQVNKTNSLATIYPDLIKFWSHENIQHPSKVTPNSTIKYLWICHVCNKSYIKRLDHQVVRFKNGLVGCPYCTNQKICIENCLAAKYPKLLNEWDYEKNIISPNNIFSSSDEKVWWKCKEYNHSWKTTPASRTNKKSGCPKCSKLVSKSETEWLNSLEIKNENRNVNLKINGKYISVDGYDPTTKTVFEFNGSFFHGDLRIYNPNDTNKLLKKTFGELYKRTLDKETKLLSAGYKVVTMWESDWKNRDQ